jgi:hypothetical protein
VKWFGHTKSIGLDSPIVIFFFSLQKKKKKKNPSRYAPNLAVGHPMVMAGLKAGRR